MATNSTITAQIRKIALDILAEKPEGVRYSVLQKNIFEQNNSFNSNTIGGATWDLETTFPDKVYKPDRGVFRSFFEGRVLPGRGYVAPGQGDLASSGLQRGL